MAAICLLYNFTSKTNIRLFSQQLVPTGSLFMNVFILLVCFPLAHLVVFILLDTTDDTCLVYFLLYIR